MIIGDPVEHLYLCQTYIGTSTVRFHLTSNEVMLDLLFLCEEYLQMLEGFHLNSEVVEFNNFFVSSALTGEQSGFFLNSKTFGYMINRGAPGESFYFEGWITIDFKATPQIGNRPLIVQFHNRSPWYATLIEWDFGDGITSNLENPEHVYWEDGLYEIKITYNINGEIYVGKRKSYIRVYPYDILPPVRDVDDQDSLFKKYFLINQRL